MSADCNFGESSDERIALQLVAGCRSHTARTNCLRLKKLDLKEIISTLKTEETAQTTADLLEGKATNSSTLHKIRRQPPQRQETPRHQTPPPRPTYRKPCPGCGFTGHTFRSEKCPARGQTCKFCGKPDHFDRVCFKKHGPPKTSRQLKTAEQDKEAEISQLEADRQPKILTSLEMSDGHHFNNLRMEVDTGADTSTVTMDTYKRLFSHLPLLKSTTTVRNYDGSPIDNIKGQFKTKVRMFGRIHQDLVHVVPNRYNSVIGRNFLNPLDIMVDCQHRQVMDGVKTRNFLTSHEINAVDKTETSILTQFPELSREEIGTYPDYKHQIDVDVKAKPVTTRTRPIPLSRRDAVEKEIRWMEEKGIWERTSKSEWIHPMVAVPKPNGSIRITTDLSRLNPYILPQYHPIPNPKDLFLELSNARFFSKLDLSKGYFQIQLHPASRNFTTTATPLGLYRYKRLPMGLKDSAQVFQKCVSQTLAGCKGCIVYIDDILIFGKTKTEHDGNLREVLHHLNAKDFRLNTDKCQFGTTTVKFLGHIISDGKVSPDSKNIQPILDAKEPTTKQQVQAFLGMINYYADFLQDISSIAEPLRALIRKGTTFDWTPQCKLSFETLKKMAAEKLSLYIFDANAETIVTTDASDVGIGAVLSQIQNRREVPIAFASHCLSPTERKYASNEREALACVWAVEN